MDGAEYRSKAVEILSQAAQTCDPEIRTQLANVAMAYARLADHVERENQHYTRVAHAARSTMQ